MLTSRLRSLPSAPIQSAAARVADIFTLVEFCHGGAGDEQTPCALAARLNRDLYSSTKKAAVSNESKPTEKDAVSNDSKPMKKGTLSHDSKPTEKGTAGETTFFDCVYASPPPRGEALQNEVSHLQIYISSM